MSNNNDMGGVGPKESMRVEYPNATIICYEPIRRTYDPADGRLCTWVQSPRIVWNDEDDPGKEKKPG